MSIDSAGNALENYQETGSLLRSVHEYKTQPHTPELINSVWRSVWKDWGRRINLTLNIPDIDRSRQEIMQLEGEGKMMIFVPNEISTSEGRHQLGLIFPRLMQRVTRQDGALSYEPNFRIMEKDAITNEGIESGWFDVEASLTPPNLNTTEDELRRIIILQGRQGQTLNQYIIGSQFFKLFTGHYFDETQYASRLLGSRRMGQDVIKSSFYNTGNIVGPVGIYSNAHYEDVGGRSSGVKKAELDIERKPLVRRLVNVLKGNK